MWIKWDFARSIVTATNCSPITSFQLVPLDKQVLHLPYWPS